MNILLVKQNRVTQAIKTGLMLAGASMMVATPISYAEDELERIVVTGSRIKHTSAQMTTPTTIIDAEAIAQSGVKNIGDL